MSARPLRPCGACSRHVRGDVARCPFCDADVTKDARVSSRVVPSRSGRSALIAIGAAAAAAASIGACSAGSVPGGGGADASADGDSGPDTNVPDTGNIAKPYGAPPARGFIEV